jgi:SAM-dependent methyltransferase
LLHVEAIDYDPLKASLGKLVSRSVLRRKLFFKALGALFLRQWHIRAALKAIKRETQIHDILDAGSGYGQYSYYMGKLWPHAAILGVDVKEEQVHDSRWFTHKIARRNVHFEVGDLTTFVRPESFDLALSVDVMEHILEDEAVFRNVCASLRPGGLFVISTPATSKEESHIDPDSVIGEHVREGYTEREFKDKLERSGFVIATMKRVYGPVWGRFAWQTLQRIPMRLLSISKLFLVIVIPWMIVVYPFAAVAMALDVRSDGRRGGGWLMIARKSLAN